ncbi:putative ABC-type branched-chain amino acid transport system, periplasmic component [Hyella patelloides LEGE 07179]|uniref:non-specific serine/threonine protein kinase n=1 Tax=Hyella patelloides LEGE 07179 TaxID=945734 RepID=A0A563VZF8_9CYAN|nr:bifunctional serine/threonine-protein kinase/ABC transporter substrate-binding protein [Hyella patelloides]VEP16821.1 putative ABC-type branched-chain amino acid transport system, periplasmic component [Hyella patelloides LEGE 07179]
MPINIMDTILNSGDILNSRYRILHQIGHGGFGRTYLAEDINRFNEPCVLKEFAPQLQGSFALEKAQELFEREAGILYRLEHPQIPRFRELFRYKYQGRGRLLLVQDYIEGQTYHTLVNNRSQQGMKFSEAEISQLLCQILPVLEYIHSIGVIHRDISPDNLILRSYDGLAVLIDFGSIKEVATKAKSQLVEEVPDTETIPLIGTVLGKNGYAPPEQMERGIVRAHSDLYALAATAVVLLTGKEPRQLIVPYSYQWHWQKEITLSPKLEWVLSKMLAPNPSDRFDRATEVRQAFQVLSTLPPNIQPVTRQLPPSKTRFTFKLSFLATLATVVFLGSSWWWQKQDFTIVLPRISRSHDLARTESPLRERFSQGEKVLIPQKTTLEKELAVAAFAQGNYDDSVSLLSASLKTLANDPEALIYLNNAQIGQEKSYSIAVSIPIGSDVNAAQEILRGVAQAQTLVNQSGGINGIALKVQIINDDNNPEIAQQVAITLSQNPEILGVIGHYASDVTLATANIYQSGQLVAISPISTSVKLSNLSPYLFRTVPSDYIAARALAEYMLHQLKQKNVAVFYNSQSNYSESLKSEFIAAVSLGGGHLVSTFDLSDANFSAADSLEQAIDKGAEVLMLAANTGTLDKALQVIQVNRQRLSLLGGDDVYTPKTLQVAGELAEDMVLAIPWHIKSDRNLETEFANVAGKLWGGEVNWRTAMAYDAAKVLIAAIKRSPTRIGIQKVLSNPNFSAIGACNQIRFFSSGDRFKSMELVKIQPSDRPSWSHEFTPLVSR